MTNSGFQLKTLGGLGLVARETGGQVLANQRKRLAFLAVLAATTNGGVPRERLFALFWPDSDSDRARNALNQMVFAVRRDLDDDAIVSDTVTLRLNPEVVDSDLLAFRVALAAGRFADAIEVYHGPFLDGVFLRDTPEFERWAEDVRHALALDYARALDSEIDAALAAGPGRAADAVRYARLLVAHDPLSTSAVLRVMRALERLGDTSAALQYAAVHAARVRSELSAEPGPELEQAVARLRANGSALSSAIRTQATSQVESLEPAALTTVESDIREDWDVRDEPQRRAQPEPSRPPRSWRRRRVLWATALVATALSSTAYIAARRALDPLRVVVASFDNETGDSTFDDFGRVAADVITEQVARAGFVDVVDPATALASSRQVRGTVARLGNQAALQMLARDTHARLVVTGSYFRDGDNLVAQARVSDAKTREVLAATEPVRAPLTDQGSLIEPLRERVMGALALRVDRRLARLGSPASPNTPTYEAYRAFVAGLDVMTLGRSRASAPYFQRAYLLDTTFVEPLIWEASAVQGTPRLRQIVEILDRRRASLSEIDQFALEHYRAVLAEDLDKALASARSAARLAPDSYWSMEVAVLLFRLGRIREAVDVWSTVDREHSWLLRGTSGVWYGYIWALHDAKLHREELKLVREARALFPEAINLMEAEAIALAMNQKWDELDHRLDSLELRSPGSVATVASELHVHGDRKHAAAVLGRCARLTKAAMSANANAAGFQGERASLLYACGQWGEAARLLDSLRSDPGQRAAWREFLGRQLAVARARMGDRTWTIAYRDSLANDSLSVRTGGLYEAARISALLGDRDRAVNLLRPLRTLPGDWLHYNRNAGDFDILVGYAPYERLRAGH
jgi:DNA-binding SARP family transcriptional activator/TolB-like protein/tetratricopeptide (TPR) repeat protein